jgi:ATP-dependent Clp protease protease subunit
MKFWNWAASDDGSRVLTLDGVIAEESWFDDEVTPKMFQAELDAGGGDVTVYINSPGGDCIAASQIYTMLAEYKGGVTVKIPGIAASAASVVAMAAKHVLMAPTAMMMIHNPWTFAAGDSADMRRAQDRLNEVKESIINAYQSKTGLARARISRLMDDETYMNANKAIELGFADGIFGDAHAHAQGAAYAFSASAAHSALMNKCAALAKPPAATTPERAAGKGDAHSRIGRVSAATLMARLESMKH